MNTVRFDFEDLKTILKDWCRQGGWTKDDQEVRDVVLKFRKHDFPTDPANLDDEKFEIRVDGLKVKFTSSRQEGGDE